MWLNVMIYNNQLTLLKWNWDDPVSGHCYTRESFPELVVTFPNYALRISLGTYSIFENVIETTC